MLVVAVGVGVLCGVVVELATMRFSSASIDWGVLRRFEADCRKRVARFTVP